MDYTFGRRYICSVLEDMRTCVKTHNFSMLESLIEEVQVSASRMEAALQDRPEYHERNRMNIKKEIRELKKQKFDLEKEVGALEEKREEQELNRKPIGFVHEGQKVPYKDPRQFIEGWPMNKES